MKPNPTRFPFLTQTSQRPWWVKIQTQMPPCVYYFGPFDQEKEAKMAMAGYVDDLVQEGAQTMDITIEQTRPKKLTISES